MTKPTPSIKILGVGSAGKNILQCLGERFLPGAPRALINPEPLPGAEFFPLDAKLLREMNLTDAATCDAAFAEQRAAVQAWCAGADVVFIVTGLGGKTGSGISPVVARAAKAAGAVVVGFASMPFDCEGNRRAQQAQAALAQLRLAGDGVVCLPNEKIMKLIGEEMGLRSVFAYSDGLLADGVSGMWRLLSCRGMLEINFDEVRDMLRANRMESFFATAEAAGENRTREIMQQLLQHPLLDGGEAFAAAGSVLVSIVGGAGLTMAEVNRVMAEINRECDGAQIVMGATEDSAFGDKLSVTIIATRRERMAEALAATPDLGVSAELMNPETVLRPASRFVPLPPTMSREKMEALVVKKSGSRGRKGGVKMRQEQLPLEIISKGRFDKSEPTIRNGEDLDEPTYIRRGLLLN